MSTQSAYAAPDAVLEPARPSPLASRIVKLFVSPGELFEEFRETAPWAGALGVTLAISIAASLAVFFLVSPDSFAELIRADFLAKTGQTPPDDMVAKIVPQARIMGLVVSVFGPFVGALLIAVVLLLVSRFAMGGNGTFNQYLAVTTHVQVMLALGSVLVAPLIFMKHDPSINLSLTLLFSDLTQKSPLFGLLHALDVFHVWGLVLFGIGIAKVDGRRSWVPSTLVLAAVYLALTVGVPMLLGMIFGHPGGA
jgi:hypothetical protein